MDKKFCLILFLLFGLNAKYFDNFTIINQLNKPKSIYNGKFIALLQKFYEVPHEKR